MILQSLADLYIALESQGEVPPIGWVPAKVSAALELSESGELLRVFPLSREVVRGKKKAEVPQVLSVPEQVKKSVNIAANFLCDSPAYFLGIDLKGKPDRAVKCFLESRRVHEEVLKQTNCPAALAVKRFYANWKPEQAAGSPLLAPYLELLGKGGALVFFFRDNYVQNAPEIQQVWNDYRNSDKDAVRMQCLVTGKTAPISRLHPSIKGVKGAQSSGASLVSFNATSSESYGKEQSYNSPVSRDIAQAYTTALNYLVADREHVQVIGDTTVVYWAQDAQPAYQDVMTLSMMGLPSREDNTVTMGDLDSVMRALADGRHADWNGISLDPDNRFYVLGLAPNAARLSVRFFLQDSFGAMLKNIVQHEEYLRIVRPAYEKFEYIPLWRLLQETVNRNARDKNASPAMAGATLRAILTGSPYPASLRNATVQRIRAEQDVTWVRAAILKAYRLRGGGNKEVFGVSVNEESKVVPYVLGRLFSVLEAVQEAANPGLNATIKDRYFNSACATPAPVFNVLLKLSNHHLRKLEIRLRTYYNKQITELLEKLEAKEDGSSIPARLSAMEQDEFILGYYHQTQKRYEKKNKEDSQS